MDAYGRRKVVAAVILFFLLLAGLIGEAMQDDILRRRALTFLLVGVFGLIVAIALLWALAVGASAHDREHPELDDWYRGLHAENGAWCCDGSDASHLADVDWESRDGHYRVRVDGEWYDVPDGAVITAPNRDGRAMVWMNDGYSGKAPRCFMPGSMT